MNQDILTLHRLRVFEAVVKYGRFNRAGRALLMSQSAVSQHIQQLENGLQNKLFVRSPQGVLLTAVGETLHHHAQQILQAVHLATEEILHTGGIRQKQLKMSASSGIAVYVLPTIMKHFQTFHPTVTLSLQTNPTSEVLLGVAEKRYDLGLVAGGCDDLDDIRITTTQYNIQLNTTTELDSPDTIKYALLNNMGVSILPEYTVAREAKRGEMHLGILLINQTVAFAWFLLLLLFLVCHLTYFRIISSSNPTVVTQYPFAHTCLPQYFLLNSGNSSNIPKASFPFKNPIISDTAYFGAMLNIICTWSG